jgi:hypothetical protein
MTWEDFMACVCQNAPSGPGLQDVLRALERHTLCTGARCFEDEADLFGTAREGGAAENTNTGTFMIAMVMLMAAATYLHVNRPAPAAITHKSGDAPARGGDDDEPPAIQ